MRLSLIRSFSGKGQLFTRPVAASSGSTAHANSATSRLREEVSEVERNTSVCESVLCILMCECICMGVREQRAVAQQGCMMLCIRLALLQGFCLLILTMCHSCHSKVLLLFVHMGTAGLVVLRHEGWFEG